MNHAPVVAVTGATGFLGAHIVAALTREGMQVRILARGEPRHGLWQGVVFDVVRGSLQDMPALECLVSGADVIVHVAGLIKAKSRAEFLRTNQEGTYVIAQAARRHAANARFIVVSSLAAREPQLSAYAASKRAGEDAARRVYNDALDQLVIVRPPAIYGPWDRETLTIFKAAKYPFVPVFGTGRIAIVHVTDAAGAIVSLVLGSGSAGVYALADTNPGGYTMAEIVANAAQALGRRPRFPRISDHVLLTAAGVSSLWGRWRGRPSTFNTGKAREMLHPDWSVGPHEIIPPEIYQAKIGIAEGFRDTVAWYKTANWIT
jgi:nucleoside-diphosphate-sugar epimerase